MEALCAAFIERHAKPRKRTWRDDQSKLQREVLPRWRGRAVTSITRRDCRQLVQSIADRGAPILANRLAALLSRLFRFAVDEEIIAANPAVRLPRPGVEAQSRPEGEREPQHYDAEEIRQIWENTEALPSPAKAIYRLDLVTGQRPSEISDLEWSELVADQWWRIPGARTKNGRAHRVFLTPLALEILAAVPRVEDEPHVFAGYRGKRQLAASNAIAFANVRPREKVRHALRNTGLHACGTH